MLIQLPQGYEPCALPMRHAGNKLVGWLVAVVTAWQILVSGKPANDKARVPVSKGYIGSDTFNVST